MQKSCIATFALSICLAAALPWDAAAGSRDQEKLDASIKAVEAKLRAQPANGVLKTWLDHARDYKSGERTDVPPLPPL